MKTNAWALAGGLLAMILAACGGANPSDLIGTDGTSQFGTDPAKDGGAGDTTKGSTSNGNGGSGSGSGNGGNGGGSGGNGSGGGGGGGGDTDAGTSGTDSGSTSMHGGDCVGTTSMQLGVPYDNACDNYFLNTLTNNPCTIGLNDCAPQNGQVYCCYQPPSGTYCSQDYGGAAQCVPK